MIRGCILQRQLSSVFLAAHSRAKLRFRYTSKYLTCRHASNSSNTDPANVKDNIYTIPNALSLSRIILSPIVAYSIVNGQHSAALALFGIAGFTDFLDGQIARRYPSQRSLLGSIIDPIGDKMLMGLSTASVWYTGLMPSWLLCIILGRDIILLSGGLAVKYQSLDKFSFKGLFNVTDGTIEVKPGWHGKLNMCLQLGAVVACLSAPIWSFQDSPYFQNYLMLTGLMGVYSLIQYILTFRNVMGKVRSRPTWMDESKKT
ncbi:hypothetical protein ACHWQZ_G002797 [Mnemiopsis leidyi]